ncbi:MAG: hypothetical protein KatS3mg087_1416 [Patescibacteria group bacterium]|nr:MAG: hypothetical protein KatS3mg087_1416 [Patescibacteria group bacterium]
MKINKEIQNEEPAIKLVAANAVGEPNAVEVSWDELKNSTIGTTWTSYGGGDLFSNLQEATLVFRNKHFAVVILRKEYSVVNGKTLRYEELKAFRFLR